MSATAAELTLHVKALKHTKQEFTLLVPADITVSQLQLRIVDAESIPIARQRLIHQGKVLKPDQPLSAYNVEDGDALHLIVRAEDAPPPSSADSASSSGDVPPPAPQMPPMQLLPSNPFMMGAFNMANQPNGQPPDLGQFVSSVLNSIGLPIAQQLQQQQQQHQLQQQLQQQQQQPQGDTAANAASAATSAAQPQPSSAQTQPQPQPQPFPTHQMHVQVQQMPPMASSAPGMAPPPAGAVQMQLVQGPHGPMLVPIQQPPQPATPTAASATHDTLPSGSPQQPAAPTPQQGGMPPFPFPFPMFVNGPQPASIQINPTAPQQTQQQPQPQPLAQSTAGAGSTNAQPSGAPVQPAMGQPLPPGMPIQLTPMPRPVGLSINAVREALNGTATASTPHTRWTAPTASPSFSVHHIPNLNPAPYPESVPGLVSLLGQIRAVLSDAPASIAHVIAALQSQAAASSTMSGSDRNNVQRDAHQLGLYLRRLGNALSGAGQLLTHVAPQAPGNAAPLALAPNAVVPLSGPVDRPIQPPVAGNQPAGQPQQPQPQVRFGPPPAGQQVQMRLVHTPNGPMLMPVPFPNAPPAQAQPLPTSTSGSSSSTPTTLATAQPTPASAVSPPPSTAAPAPAGQLPAAAGPQPVGGSVPFPFAPFMFTQPGQPFPPSQPPYSFNVTPFTGTAPLNGQHQPVASATTPPVVSASPASASAAAPAAAPLPDGAPAGIQTNPFAAMISQLLPTVQQALSQPQQQHQQPQPLAAAGDATNSFAAADPVAAAANEQASAAITGLMQGIGPLVQQLTQTAQQAASGQQQQQQAANFGNMFSSMMGAIMQGVQQASANPAHAPMAAWEPAPPSSANAVASSTTVVDAAVVTTDISTAATETTTASPTSSSSTTNSSHDSNAADDDTGLLDMLITIATRSVGRAGLLAILNGDLSSLDRTEAEVYHLIATLLNEDNSSGNRAAAAHYHATTITPAVFTPAVLEVRAHYLRAGAEPVTRARPLVEQSLDRLFDGVLSRHTIREAGGVLSAALCRFSEFLRVWGEELVGSVTDVLAREAYTDGVESASVVMERALLTRPSLASGLGAMTPLLGDSVRSSLVTMYLEWKRTEQPARAAAAGSEDGPAEGQDDADVLEEKKDEQVVGSSSTQPPSSEHNNGVSDSNLGMDTDANASDEACESLKRKLDDDAETEARKK